MKASNAAGVNQWSVHYSTIAGTITANPYEFRNKESRSCDIAARMREAGNDAHGNHIAGGCCDDWDYRCRTVGCINSRCVGHYDIDIQINQLGR